MSSLTIYFKINLYKFISNYLVLGRSIILPPYFKSKFINKYLVLGRSIIFSHYFKSNFRLSKFICKENTDLFKKWIQVTYGDTDYCCFWLFSCCCENFFLVVRNFSRCGNFFLVVRRFFVTIFFFLKEFFLLLQKFSFFVRKSEKFLPQSKTALVGYIGCA